MLKKDKMLQLLDESIKDGETLNDMVNQVVKAYTKPLDDLIEEWTILLDSVGGIDEVPENDLEFFCVKIPAAMYYTGSKMEQMGLLSDMSALKKKTAFNEQYIQSTGSAQVKKSKAENDTLEESMLELVYKRAYSTINERLKQAAQIQTSIKKVLTKIITDIETHRSER